MKELVFQHILTIVASMILTQSVLAQTGQYCDCDEATGTKVFRAVSGDGHDLALKFRADPITQAVKVASLCANSAGRLNEAKLWMPGMGHGSSPTVLNQVTQDCTVIEKVNFIMKGNWQFRLTFDDGDGAVFNFIVE